MDRTRKKELYLQLESLQAYILLSQGEPRVEMFRRTRRLLIVTIYAQIWMPR